MNGCVGGKVVPWVGDVLQEIVTRMVAITVLGASWFHKDFHPTATLILDKGERASVSSVAKAPVREKTIGHFQLYDKYEWLASFTSSLL